MITKRKTRLKFDLLCDLSDRICGVVVILIDAIRKYLIGHQMVEALWVYAFRFVANFHCGIYGHSERAVLNITDAKTAGKIKEERFTSDLALFCSHTKDWDPSLRQTFVEYVNCQLCGTISQFRLTRSIFLTMRSAVYIWLRSMLLSSSGNLSLIAELIYDWGELFTKLIYDRCIIWE